MRGLQATRIAGLGIIEAMRDAWPDMYEYELQADAEFKKYGACGAAYFALIATGKNTFYSHYHKDAAKVEKGDLGRSPGRFLLAEFPPGWYYLT